MATRYYVLQGIAGTVAPTTRGTWTGTLSGPITAPMGPDKAAAGGTQTAYGPSLGGASGQNFLAYKLVGPLLAAQTISGTVDLAIPASIANTDADPHWALHIYVMQPDGSVRGTLLANYADAHSSDEWSTSVLGRTLVQQTLSSVVASAGDRIVAEIGVIRRAGVTARTATTRYGGTGATDTTSGSASTTIGWLEFSGTITTLQSGIVSQAPVEVLVDPDPSIVFGRASQLPVEVLVGPNYAVALVSQLPVEVLISATGGGGGGSSSGARSMVVVAG